MKPVIAAVAMLLLLTLTMLGAKNASECAINKRAKADNLEWRNSGTPLPSATSPAS